MPTRSLPLLLVLTLVPDLAWADRHPLQCFGVGSFSKREVSEEQAAATATTEDDDSTTQRTRLSCAAFLEDYTAGTEGGNGVVPAATGQIGGETGAEFLLGGYYFFDRFDRQGKFQPFVRVMLGGVTTTSDDRVHGATVAGGGIDYMLNPCPVGATAPCKKLVFTLHVGGEGVLLWTQPKRVFPRVEAGLGFRLELH